jgi:hypothetical protein
MDPGGQTEGQFGLEQRFEGEVHRSGSLPAGPKTLGDPIAEDLRFVVKTVVGRKTFIDMTPNRSNNYCCGGGGGFCNRVSRGAPLLRPAANSNKSRNTGADYCITPCHNCHAQIHDLKEHYEGKYHTVHIWTTDLPVHGHFGRKRTRVSGAGSGGVDHKEVAVSVSERSKTLLAVGWLLVNS